VLLDACKECKAATVELFSAVDEQDFEAIERLMGRSITFKLDKLRLAETFSEIHNELGACDAPRILSIDCTTDTSGTQARMSVRAPCTEGDGRAELVWKVNRGTPKLESFSFLREIANSSK